MYGLTNSPDLIHIHIYYSLTFLSVNNRPLTVYRLPRLFAISAAAPSLSRLHFVGQTAAAVRGKLMKQDVPASGYSTEEDEEEKNHTRFDLE